jgi:HK97 gp10 family phage protein
VDESNLLAAASEVHIYRASKEVRLVYAVGNAGANGEVVMGAHTSAYTIVIADWSTGAWKDSLGASGTLTSGQRTALQTQLNSNLRWRREPGAGAQQGLRHEEPLLVADKTIAVTGLAELDKKLEALPGKIQRRALRKALLAGADIIRDEARAIVHRKSGKLAAAIESSASLSVASADDREFLNAAGVSASDAAIAIVSVRGGPARRAHLTEFGAAPHEERPKKKKVLADQVAGKVFGTSGEAPRLEGLSLHAAGVRHPRRRRPERDRRGSAGRG